MAIDKSRTSPFMKAMIIFLALSFVIGIGFTGVFSIASCSVNAPLVPGGSTATTNSSTDTSAAIAAIDARFTPQVAARETSITANPKNYDLLLAQGNDYYDWALQVSQTASQITTEAAQLWGNAATYYQRALAIKNTDPNTATDCAIALFYSGKTTDAIALAEKTRKDNPTFAPVVYNLAVFYQYSGAADANIKATATYQAYLKLEPTGANADAAKAAIQKLGSTATTTTP